jgi:hypothetical protein
MLKNRSGPADVILPNMAKAFEFVEPHNYGATIDRRDPGAGQ